MPALTSGLAGISTGHSAGQKPQSGWEAEDEVYFAQKKSPAFGNGAEVRKDPKRPVV